MPPLDLSHIPVVDNHCHGVYAHQGPFTIEQWRGCFTESRDPNTRTQHVATTLFYQRLIHTLAEFMGCAPTEVAVLVARQARAPHELIGDLLRAANIEALLVDQGYPPSDQVMPDALVGQLGGCRTLPMLRLEVLFQRLIGEHARLATVIEALRAELADVRARGFVALKTIVAYRTGLDIRTWPPAAVAAAFRTARQAVAERGEVRLAHPPLLDTLLHVAFAAAAQQEVPVQFHTGYGDTDADLRLANPLHLRAVLEQRAYRGLPVVLLHEAYPYTREGAYLAAVYDRVYLDLSYATPFLSYGEMLAFTRAALGVAPTSKLLYSSDAVGLPELHWIGAIQGRRILGAALGEAVAHGELSAAEAVAAGTAVLRDNAVRLYRL
jgi:hypothetical protein